MIARSGRVHQTTTAVPTLVAALAVLLSASAFAGILADGRWLFPAMMVVGGVAAVGLLGRGLGWWPPLVVLGQLVSVLVMLVALFSGSAILGVLPGMSALSEIATVLSEALDVVRNGIPPVPADPAIQCLVCLGLGLVAVLVDAIAVAAAAPAVAGLVLLCVFAIPASLAESMLPWGSFVAAASGFALLLVSGGPQHRWGRGPSWRETLLGRHLASVVGLAAVLALLTGSVFTGVGTEGRLPGDDQSSSSTGAIGLHPFTSLRGQLDRDQTVELFRVRGLPRETYLRAMTLRKFEPGSGWRLDGLTQGVDAASDLPLPTGTTVDAGIPATVRIDPVGYRDPWLPVFGTPKQVSGMGPDWRYDPASGIVFTQTRQDSRPYVEQFTVPDPTPEQLRGAVGDEEVDQAYLDSSGVAPEIIDLARRLTSGAPTNFDKAVALNRFFTDPANGFTYDLQTAPPRGNDALVDFLFHGKRGFCEQYASSMAVLLRAVGVPSRVAVGFTAGFSDGDEQVITTNDAHAWVEAHFPGWGWITFDPTPLDDGRTSLPQYLNRAPLPGEVPPAPSGQAPTPPPPTEQPSGQDRPDEALPPAPPLDPGGGGGWLGWAGVLLLAGAAAAAAPAALRQARRQRRLRVVAAGLPGAADTAWDEVLDEVRDRGTDPAAHETLRNTATSLIRSFGLDSDGARALNALVTSVETEWYAPAGRQGDASLPESLRAVVTSLGRCAPLSWRDRLLPRSALALFRSAWRSTPNSDSKEK